MDPWIMASAASVLLSWYFFFVKKDRHSSLFVGLWPPTFLAFGSYFKQTRMHDELDRAMGQEGIVDRVEQIVQGR